MQFIYQTKINERGSMYPGKSLLVELLLQLCDGMIDDVLSFFRRCVSQFVFDEEVSDLFQLDKLYSVANA
jgi:hypothetical protein